MRMRESQEKVIFYEWKNAIQIFYYHYKMSENGKMSEKRHDVVQVKQPCRKKTDRLKLRVKGLQLK